MTQRIHYLGESEYDTALCGDSVLGGGTLYVSRVTCFPCLRKLIDIGKQAETRIAQLDSQCDSKTQCECH